MGDGTDFWLDCRAFLGILEYVRDDANSDIYSVLYAVLCTL